MVKTGGTPAPVVPAVPISCQVKCVGCTRVLNVPAGIMDFQCPKCKLPQALPPMLRQQQAQQGGARGIDSSKIQLPCANCRAILNVPPGLTRFVCPQCRVELAVDPSKLQNYITSLAQLNFMNGQNSALLNSIGNGGSIAEDAIARIPQFSGLGFQEEVNEVALEVEQEEDEAGTAGETFTDYRPSKLSLGPPHPDPIVETASLSAVQPPEPKYVPKIVQEMENTDALSCLQLETIVYASQRHLHHLSDGSRSGFFLGDGAGVGKGRTIAGLIWENWHHARRKSLWLSVGSDLKFDAKRDLEDVGAKEVEVHALNKLPYAKLDSKAVGIKEGVVFLTYSSLIASSDKGHSRLEQLVKWCGPGFDGLILFDECHKAKNLIPEAGGQPTKTGEAVLELQTKLPEARVVYCSATGASEPRNMGYMARLGLWGMGTDFPNFQAFLGALEKRGVGALELVAMDMKARGMYVCRTLSFKGAEFAVAEVPLEPTMMEMYTKAVQVWGELRVHLMAALDALHEKKPSQSQLWRLYWASHQRFFRHMCMSAKVPAAVRLAKQALAEGKCVVIGLQSTGEARTEEAINKYGVELDDFVSGPRELLLKLVEEHYPLPEEPRYKQFGEESIREDLAKKRPVDPAPLPSKGRLKKSVVPEKVMEEDSDDEDDETESDVDHHDGSDDETRICSVCRTEDAAELIIQCSRCYMMAHSTCLVSPPPEPLANNWMCLACDEELAEYKQAKASYISELWQRYEDAKARKVRVLETIRALELPNNPLDDIIDQLGGPDAVAEMSGRRNILVRATTGKGVIYQARNSKDVPLEMMNMNEKQQFMDERKLVAVISEAASAGVSLQADRRARNQRRRVHITLELPWSADRAIQQFGRTHRSNQTSAPQYRLLFTNLGGERRFASIVAKRLETLGALTQGDRRAGPSLSAFNYDSTYGKRALGFMYKAIMEQTVSPLAPPECASTNSDDAKQFYQAMREALLSVGLIRDAVPVAPYSTAKSNNKHLGRIVETDLHDVGRFLNRSLGLPPEIQNRLFEFFVSIFDLLVHDARKDGQFDSGIVDIQASRIDLQGVPKTLHVDALSGAPTTLYVLVVDKGLTWEGASKILDENVGEGHSAVNGFYQSRREWLGRAHHLLALERAGSGGAAVRIFRPQVGEAPREMSVVELNSKYMKVAATELAKAGWIEDYRLTADQCMHGPKCKTGAACTVGKRVQHMYLLGGLILPVWGTVEKALAKQMRASHRRLRVVRVETTSDSQRIVGLHIPNPAVEAVRIGLEALQTTLLKAE